jgi:DNA polymerase bacteriophage-type
MPRWANVDLETASTVDLTAVGAPVYAEHPTTHILCMAYKVDGGPTQLWWPHMPFPADFAELILAGGEVHAWNAAFERTLWPLLVARHGAPAVPLGQWRCTMVRALLQGFPAKLEHAGPSMGLGVCKDDAGHRLMLQLCKPRQRWAPGKKGYDDAYARTGSLYEQTGEHQLLPDGEVVRWWQDTDKLARLGAYCVTDVDTEAAAGAFLDPWSERELAGWQLDQRINDRGFYVDTALVHAALSLVAPATKRANKLLFDLTGGALKSVTKPNEIRAWINEQLGLELASIDKKVLNDILVTMKDTLPANVKAVIKLRLAAAKTSTAKLRALLNGLSADGRFRGGLQYAGAGRTNRWAGRRFQPHNLPRPEKWAIHAVPYVLECALDFIELAFGSGLEAISNILRSCIVAAPGRELHFADYNAIEARVTAWLCGAWKILEAYRSGKDPYRMMAAKVFGIEDWTTISKDGFERFLGKQIILGCGFQMGAKRFQGSCRDYGQYIDMALAERSITTYREDNPEIPTGWRALDGAAATAMHNPCQWVPALGHKVHFWYDGSTFLRVALPSGRLLSYLHPRLEADTTPWGQPCWKFYFWGWNNERQRMEWANMYGGKWMENIVQATARDVMLDSMLALDAGGWSIILTVHDEEGAEELAGQRQLDAFIRTMSQPPAWAPDLPLAVEGWTGHRYRK